VLGARVQGSELPHGGQACRRVFRLFGTARRCVSATSYIDECNRPEGHVGWQRGGCRGVCRKFWRCMLPEHFLRFLQIVLMF